MKRETMNPNNFVKAFFLFCAMVLITGCVGMRIVIGDEGYSEHKEEAPPPWAPAHGYRAKHRYHYYPASRVYFEKEEGLWFYYRDGEWQVSAKLPSAIRIDVDGYVVLEMDTDKPYQYDPDVRTWYPSGKAKKKHKWKE
jgi:hypothetical protein